jgi:Tol biopolymer transport system component
LTSGFIAASDPEISFDGKRILFAAKRNAAETWQIFEMQTDGSGVRQVTHEAMDCRSPIYLSPLYTISSEEPSLRICYAGSIPGHSPSLYTVLLDGSQRQRISYGPSGERDPVLMEDGRILFAGSSLSAVNPDGADYALFAPARFVRTPSVTAGRLVVFVEAGAKDEAGLLASVSLRRPLRSYRKLSEDGVFHSPSALPDGQVLVAKLTSARRSFGLFRFDPSSGASIPVYDDPNRHDIQAKAVAARASPDGRSSVVDEKDPEGTLYCLSVHTTDVAMPGARRLRVLAEAKQLGELDLEDDGSFQVRVPANVPVQLQLLDEKGSTLRTSGWIWVRNHENRGCIGCHEDPELTPENRLAKALTKPAVILQEAAKQAVAEWIDRRAGQ